MLVCPKCGSSFLMIKMNAGLERLKILFTGTRAYCCRDCDLRFRAPDRRAERRAGAKPAVAHRQTA